jgi:hypothetical protein
MKKIGNFIPVILLAVLLAPCGRALAAEAEVSASISAEKIGLDDTLIFTLTFSNIENPSQPNLSHWDDFKILQTSRSSEFQFRDGASTSSTHFVYYLMPVRTGKLTLPQVTYRHQGRDYRTQGFTVEVVKGSVAQAQTPQASQPSFFDDDFFNSPFQNKQPQTVDAFLRAVLPKKSCLKGEQLLFRVLLYTRNRIEAVNMLSGASFAGFWQEWFPVPQSIAAANENVNGVIYQVYEIRKAALFANESGTLTIPSLQFELELADAAAMFFGARPIRRSTQELQVVVSEPSAAAAGLPVGQFTFSLACPLKRADINEIVTLQMKISGSGNCKAIIPPTLPGSEQYLVYPAKISQESTFHPETLTGILKAELPVSFKKTGTATFPPLEFKYFDPARGGIVSLRSAPVSIQVSGEKMPTDLSQTLSRSAIVQKGEDIDFIRNGPVHDQSRLIYRQKWFAGLILAFFAFNLLALGKIAVWDRHVVASPLLRNRQLLARTLRALDSVRHNEDIAPVMEKYFQEKSGLGLAEINNEKIAAVLRQRQVSGPSIEKFLFIKSQSELARFSPHKKSALELKKDVRVLHGLLREIDRKLKWK